VNHIITVRIVRSVGTEGRLSVDETAVDPFQATEQRHHSHPHTHVPKKLKAHSAG
jgi:hypothetical protein